MKTTGVLSVYMDRCCAYEPGAIETMMRLLLFCPHCQLLGPVDITSSI